MKSKYSVSANGIDAYIWDVRYYLMRRRGVDESAIIIDPLVWYIHSGRASGEWLRLLFGVKPFVIGRILGKSESYDDAIGAISKRIGYAQT